mmetsp:Transcript_66961/g.179011  ORF Transcript_66961/g.179011 Transcript_66961/m.179011 type:complete len:218 (+) Transcript_66961:296-949(+)
MAERAAASSVGSGFMSEASMACCRACSCRSCFSFACSCCSSRAFCAFCAADRVGAEELLDGDAGEVEGAPDAVEGPALDGAEPADDAGRGEGESPRVAECEIDRAPEEGSCDERRAAAAADAGAFSFDFDVAPDENVKVINKTIPIVSTAATAAHLMKKDHDRLVFWGLNSWSDWLSSIFELPATPDTGGGAPFSSALSAFLQLSPMFSRLYSSVEP